MKQFVHRRTLIILDPVNRFEKSVIPYLKRLIQDLLVTPCGELTRQIPGLKYREIT